MALHSKLSKITTLTIIITIFLSSFQFFSHSYLSRSNLNVNTASISSLYPTLPIPDDNTNIGLSLTDQKFQSSILLETEDEEDEEDDLDDDGIDDKIEDKNLRDLDIEFSEDQIEIESRLSQGEDQDQINIGIKKEDYLEITISYESEVGSDETELEFSIIFKRLIEFTDTNNNSKYDPSAGEFIKQIELDDFEDFHHSQIPSDNGSTIEYFKLNSTDGIFTVHVYVGNEFFRLNDSLITPTEFKIDLEINNFTYQNSGSYLSLEMVFQAETEFSIDEETEDEELGYGSDESSLNLTDNEFAGFFSWNEQALIDSVFSTVTFSTTLEEDEDGTIIHLNYPNGDKIYHDPKLGIAGILRGVIDTPVSPFNILLLLVIVIPIAFLLIFGLTMTKLEYRQYLLNRVLHMDTGVHKLSMEQVLENKIRSNIINLIIDEPGVHYKDLLRRTGTSASNLAWHLDILEAYKIIHKQRIGHFLIFYPYLDKNPFAEFNYKIAKSKTTLEIFELVGDNTGIFQSEIAKRMGLDHKTVKYHLDKLTDAELIYSRKKGRRNQFLAFISDKPDL